MSQEKKPTVLLIESNVSLRRLISIGLQHRGMHVIEAHSLAELPAATEQPDLLVLDIDNGISRNWSIYEEAQSRPELSTLPTVVLAWECDLADLPETPQCSSVATATEVACLAKPFDARILYTTIDRFIRIQAAKTADLEAQAEAHLLASYSAQAAPSIWPIVTAAGLLLVVIGMMFQYVVAILGILIVIVGLLVWMLGTKPGAREVSVSV